MSNLAVYMKQPAIVQRFQDVLGRGANGYIQSVIIAASDEKLQGCTEMSVMKAALRAASLGLSCDPVQKEAQLIPRNRKTNDGWVKEASFEPHYLGLYKLAIRTGKYWTINVIPVMKNQEVRMGRDGLHYVYEGDMRIDHFPVNRITAKNIDGVKGWLGYFKTTKGFEKTEYMSIDEIMDHAYKYSPAYTKDIDKGTKYSTWSDPDILPTMQMKTVLRQLLKWADTSGDAGAALKAALDAVEEGEAIDVEVDDLGSDYPEGSDYEDLQSQDEVIADLMGEPSPEVEMIDPLSAKAVAWASDQWNISKKEAKIEIGKKYPDGKVRKDEFKKFVTGV